MTKPIKYLDGDGLKTLIELINGKLSSKADKSTTLQEYGITDAYSKTEIEEITTSEIDKVFSDAGESFENMNGVAL